MPLRRHLKAYVRANATMISTNRHYSGLLEWLNSHASAFGIIEEGAGGHTESVDVIGLVFVIGVLFDVRQFSFQLLGWSQHH